MIVMGKFSPETFKQEYEGRKENAEHRQIATRCPENKQMIKKKNLGEHFPENYDINKKKTLGKHLIHNKLVNKYP